ncbi:MAG: zf-TFIIB domain-containing protein [Pseudomonadota bacterium]
MRCPIDGTQLVMADRNGVEIDYCPECRGVWLDRGELDKIIERSVVHAAPRHDSRERDYRRSKDDSYRRKKRGGFLEDLFDF